MKLILVSLVLFTLSIGHANAQHKYFGRRSLCALVLANNTGRGFGLRYEAVQAKDKFSWVFPLSFCFGYVDRRHGLHTQSQYEGEAVRPLMVFFSPGFRIYPTLSSGVVRYSIGLNLMIGAGEGKGHVYINGTNQLESRAIAGLVVANAVSFHVSPHIRAGLELSLGAGTDNGLNSAAGPDVVNPFGQLSLSLGYRW